MLTDINIHTKVLGGFKAQHPQLLLIVPAGPRVISCLRLDEKNLHL